MADRNSSHKESVGDTVNRYVSRAKDEGRKLYNQARDEVRDVTKNYRNAINMASGRTNARALRRVLSDSSRRMSGR